jgi:hypothetical protein
MFEMNAGMQTTEDPPPHTYITTPPHAIVTMPSEVSASPMEPPIRFRRKDNKQRARKMHAIVWPEPEEEQRVLQFQMDEIDSLIRGWEAPKRYINTPHHSFTTL